MTNLFGAFTIDSTLKDKPKVTLLDMAKKKFAGENELINEIELFLKSRRQVRQYPSKVSWEMQLDLLEKVPRDKRVSQVKNSILKGYRAIAWDNSKSGDVFEMGAATSTKSKPMHISNKVF